MSLATCHYTVLGIKKASSEKEITLAFRRMVMRWHPDRHPVETQKAAEIEFKKVKEAYEVLSDSSKKAIYDNSAASPRQNPYSGQSNKPSGSRPAESQNKTYSEKRAREVDENYDKIKSTFPRGKDILKTIVVTVSEALNGCKYLVEDTHTEECGECNGYGGNRLRCQECHGTGSKSSANRSKIRCTHCDGFGTKTITCDTCGGSGKQDVSHKLSVNIPAGVFHGSKLTVRDKGKPSKLGGFNGDLIITIKIKLADNWTCIDADLFGSVNIGYSMAMLGGSIEIEIPTGKTLKVTIPAQTNSGKRFRLVGQGLKKGATNQCGDIVLTVAIVLPLVRKVISPEVAQLLRYLDEI